MSLLALREPILIVIAIVMLVTIIMVFCMFAWILFPWLQAYMSGTRVSMFSILGMQFRRIPVRKVMSFLIMAKQAGVSICCREMESAYLQGVDLEKVTLAMIHAKREGKEFQFRELVEADLEDKLAEKLER